MPEFPDTIRAINALPAEEKEAIYTTLLPDWIFDEYEIDRQTHEFGGHRVVSFICPQGSRAVEITVKDQAMDRDPLFYLHAADTFNNQILVLLLVINDPHAPRFNIDVDEHGNPTYFGTGARNKPAELAAMRAGLAPGQVRHGLRAARLLLPPFETFIQRMGHDMFLIEPMAYHNAIAFERYGFSYMRGLKDMKLIHEEFQPGGVLHNRLTPDNPFRHPDAWKSVRGRSWAIHDGILGHSFTGFQMYRRIGKDSSVNTFPDARW